MPHLIIEHDVSVAFADDTLEALHAAVNGVGAFPIEGLKSRFVPHARTRVGTGSQQVRFVHASLSLLAGRPTAVLNSLSDAVAQALEPRLQVGPGVGCQLSVEVREMARGPYRKLTVGAAV